LPKDSLLILGTNKSIFKSIDYGATWSLSSSGIPASGGSNVEDIIFKGDSILVATYGNGIFCSVDYCQTWFGINNGFSDLQRSCLLSNSNRLFAGSMYGGSGIYVSDDNGANWVPKNNGVPMMWVDPTKYVDITSFTVVDQVVFASTHGGNVLKSENNGESWEQLACPNNYIWRIVNINNTLFCGHDGTGITESKDYGNTWSIENDGLEGFNDRDIRSLCKSEDFIYTGSWSYKIFKRPIDELATEVPKNSIKNQAIVSPNPISDNSKIIISQNLSGPFTFEIFNGMGVCIRESCGTDLRQIILSKGDFKKGIYFFRLIFKKQQTVYGKFIVN
jgi:hypothetical protein